MENGFPLYAVSDLICEWRNESSRSLTSASELWLSESGTTANEENRRAVGMLLFDHWPLAP